MARPAPPPGFKKIRVNMLYLETHLAALETARNNTGDDLSAHVRRALDEYFANHPELANPAKNKRAE